LLSVFVDTELVQRNHDLTAQLAGRRERLGWLIQFINDNAVLNKVGPFSLIWPLLTIRSIDVAKKQAKTSNGCRKAACMPSAMDTA
jgi:hypothetical protein